MGLTARAPARVTQLVSAGILPSALLLGTPRLLGPEGRAAGLVLVAQPGEALGPADQRALPAVDLHQENGGTVAT